MTPSEHAGISLSDLAFAMEFDYDITLQAAQHPAATLQAAQRPAALREDAKAAATGCKGNATKTAHASIDYFREAVQGIEFDPVGRTPSVNGDVLAFDKALLNHEAPASAAWESPFADNLMRMRDIEL
jgi:hypothetical protein